MLTPSTHPTPDDDRATPTGSEQKRIRVLLVDDHPAVRVGARNLIDDQPDMCVVTEAASVDEALAKLSSLADVAVVDYHLGEGRDGLWLTAELKRRESPPRVLVYSAFADGALATAALLAGADGLLGKHELGHELCRAIRRLARGQQHVPAITSSVAHAMRSGLEPQDQAIFGMLLHGMAPDEIVARLGITSEELHDRRAIILRSLKPARAPSGLPEGAQAPLDYERPKRHARSRAA